MPAPPIFCFQEMRTLLKILYRICCGIDVHKKFVVATISITNSNNVTTYQTQVFQTFHCDLLKLRNWLVENKCRIVCMESTGKYWIPVFNVLEDYCSITLANPRFVKNIPGKKSDTRDSVWLTDLQKHGLVPGSYIPCKAIRELRDLFRYKSKLSNFASSEKNRVQNSLTVSNIMLSSVVSDTFGKSSLDIINHLIAHPGDTSFDFASMLRTSLKKKSAEISKAIEDRISKEQALKLEVCFNHHSAIHKCMDIIDSQIAKLIKPFKRPIQLLDTLPGITEKSAANVIAEIGVDMSVFHSSKHLCSWAGLTPQCNESAGKKKSVRISRAGVYLKPLLVQCANAAIRDKSCTVFKDRYAKIKKRRGHKRAIIAVARMMLTCIYHMLLKNEAFNSSLYEVPSPASKESSKFNDVQQAIEVLKMNGYDVDNLQLLAPPA
jgi:transposase